ncbi:hypothetical protein Bca4012_058509 [Brassica carinata]
MDQLINGDDETMNQPADEDVLAIPEGPNTCSRTKKLNGAIGGLLRSIWKQEESLGQSLMIQITLTTNQATSTSS